MSTVTSTNNIAEAAKANQEKTDSAPTITNSTVSPEDKKKTLRRKQTGPNPLKYQLWIAGHLACLVFGSISFLFQIFWLPNVYYINSICYRLSFIGAIMAMTATFSHKFGLNYLPEAPTLIAQQNFQYLVLAIVWIFTFKSIFKIIPYFLISLLQVSKHKKINAVLKSSDALASVIAYDELILILYLFVRTLAFRNTSGYQMVIFLFFYWLRILYNPETGDMFKAIVGRLDWRMSTFKSEKVHKAWGKVKETLDTKVHDSGL
jgi:hypothetical protein